ncbi:MAG TPA: hypothetical protein VNT42_07005 [Sphingomonas sp.]|nr:hypothetical protein [Sphingomonas sp.]
MMDVPQGQGKFEHAVAMLARDLPRMRTADACARLGWLKRQAVLEGYLPTAMLADGLASAITRDGRNVPLRTWLDALSLAAGFGAHNDDAGPLLLATVGVRFAG